MNTSTLHFVNPIEGDMLHTRDGQRQGNTLLIPVQVQAPTGHSVTINDQPATEHNGLYTAEVSLSAFKNTLVARDHTTNEQARITVFRLLNFAGHYRLSIDDNIWFLRDIYRNQDTYSSLFDNPFLGFLREVHAQYGTPIHLNLFYQTDGFNLSQFPDKYRAEWQQNAHWLRLSFHALAEFPDMPYRTAGYEVVRRDCDLIMNEIRRFAGEPLMGPVTTIHWGEATMEGSRAMRDAGYVAQLGYFNVDDDLPAVSYYLDVPQRRHLKKRFVWHDTRESITFVRSSIVLDKKDLPDIVPFLNSYADAPSGLPPYVDFLVHEQYFYPFYEAYQPDYRDRILTAVQWATDNGYRPAFLGDALFNE
ncbi:hypothetical protein F5984_04140 [Rudanella paleaurantiibacter]|uniref:Uncharacterized protein n=1 Tax=Rudanella paleaurantiibacter TaxID=2614655 RepID=A0A7J5U5L4_9BACT|nr:hypothetical protein [Rudanella paleaurantiibacter]KAB7733134.1 hypothetical protein F5984_04140 [Rudanella paleaurantiibacter]